MKENIAWNYPKGLVTFVPLFFLTQFIVAVVLIFLYADSFFDINEEDGIIIPDGIFVEYFNITCTISFVIIQLISFQFLLKKINMPVKFVYDLNGSYLELHTINNHLFGFGNSNKKIKCDRYNKAQIFKIKYLGGEEPVMYYCLEIKDREGNDTGRLNYISSENVVKDIAKIVGFTLPDTSSYIAKDGDVVDTSDWGYSKY
tara:strand:+ start:230 stop:832 length:603 start_codon:yes stop_codon:yes gene_type:complete